MRARSKHRKSTTWGCNAWSRVSMSTVVWSLIGCLLMLHLYSIVRQRDTIGGIRLHTSHHILLRELEAVEEEDIQIPPPK
ncbi:hypothetical protein CRG98_034832, partial [Punica granatum]